MPETTAPSWDSAANPAVKGTFTTTGQSAAFTPEAGRDFNFTIFSGSGTVQLERNFADGSGWAPYTYVDGTPMTWSGPVSTSITETETGVQWRLNCTAFSSNLAYRISQ